MRFFYRCHILLYFTQLQIAIYEINLISTVSLGSSRCGTPTYHSPRAPVFSPANTSLQSPLTVVQHVGNTQYTFLPIKGNQSSPIINDSPSVVQVAPKPLIKWVVNLFVYYQHIVMIFHHLIFLIYVDLRLERETHPPIMLRWLCLSLLRVSFEYLRRKWQLYLCRICQCTCLLHRVHSKPPNRQLCYPFLRAVIFWKEL